MKITTFNPQIITKDAESLVKFFEELAKKDGFNVCNVKAGLSKTYNLKNFCTVTPNVNVVCNPTGFDAHGTVNFSAGVGFTF